MCCSGDDRMSSQPQKLGWRWRGTTIPIPRTRLLHIGLSNKLEISQTTISFDFYRLVHFHQQTIPSPLRVKPILSLRLPIRTRLSILSFVAKGFGCEDLGFEDSYLIVAPFSRNKFPKPARVAAWQGLTYDSLEPSPTDDPTNFPLP